MINWTIKEEGFYPEKVEDNGNKFLVGNGYMGIRGTLEEFRKDKLVAVNLAGIYDKVGDGWKEPLNAPNGLYTILKVDGIIYSLPEVEPENHMISLDYRKAILMRETAWKCGKGMISLKTERFLDMQNPHFIYSKYAVTLDFQGEVEIITGIDGEVWDIHGPHYRNLKFSRENGYFFAEAATQSDKDLVWVGEGVEISKGEQKIEEKENMCLRKIHCHCLPKETISFTKQVAIFTNKDRRIADRQDMSWLKSVMDANRTASYEKKRQLHINQWENLWKRSEVFIEGDDEAMEALNYSLYHLHSITPRHSSSMSIAARGLSGQTYKGAVFWDTEMFILDFFLYTEPQVAKTLLKYRIDTLEGAKSKARDYGFKGAFYAWESQEGGEDACSDYNVTDVFTGRPMRTFFRDKQIHISSAVVFGIMNYLKVTGDYTILVEGGLETIVECARFYYGLLMKRVGGNHYELLDVIGPDEYHERVNNNGYTNRMAKFTLEVAYNLLEDEEESLKRTKQELSKNDSLEQLAIQFKDAAEHIYIPQPDENGVIEQFDGYHQLEDVSVEEVRTRLLHEKEYWGGAYGVASHTKVIKQADVVTWLTMFSQEFSKEILINNWNYYEPRTEHGSSLSACMYAWLACICGYPEKAYPFFLKSARADLAGGGKQWAGLVYIGGTHPAAAGGAYMTAINGFAGLTFEGGEIKINPNLPPSWKKMRFYICFQSKYYEITIEPGSYKIEPCRD